jgi:hypothetical protein
MTNDTYKIKKAREVIEKIKLELRQGKDYDRCEQEAQEPLAILNARGKEIAKQFGMKHRDLSFTSIMR